MIIRTSYGLRAALVAVAALGWWTGVSAQTTAGTTIANRASVNYTVAGLPQAVIESSPNGNTTPGLGAGLDTEFLVDNMIDLSVSEFGGGATVVTPGMSDQVLAFTVTNSGNSPEGYELTVIEEIGTLLFGENDTNDFGLANLVVRVDEDPSGGDGTGNDAYDGTESATAIDVLNPGQSITVFILAAPVVPLHLINDDFANVRLQARAAEPGTNGANLEVASGGLNLPDNVEILFADAGFDATESAADQFAVVTAGLTITKVQTVLSDGFSASNPRSIPGATVEYVITIENTSGGTSADGVSLSDPVPADTTFVGTNVDLTGLAITSCTADANDGDADGCGIEQLGLPPVDTLTIDSGVIGSVGPGDTVTVAFQVTID